MVSPYNEPTMKTKNIFNACIFLIAILTLTLVITNFNMPVAAAKDLPVTVLQQATPTPPVDSSEIGSTSGILVMGVVIVLIIAVPLILQKRK